MLQLNRQKLIPEGPIVRAAEFQTVLDAEAIIADAENRAAQIVADAEQRYEERKQQGYEDGMNEGRMEMTEKIIDTVASSVDYVSSLEESVVHLVTKSLRKILGEVPQPNRITTIARHALAVARNESKVTLRLHPNDVDTVQDRIDNANFRFQHAAISG